MTPTRWDPSYDLLRRLAQGAGHGGREEISTSMWAPPVDIYETGNDLVIKIDVPEVNRDDIQITMDNNVLTIRGERKPDQGVKGENYHRAERPRGQFSRSFTLPADIAGDKIGASYRDGTLSIRVPKAETSKPRTIEIG